MTIPTGYPDWQHIDTKVGRQLAFDTAITVSASKVYGPFYVGNYPGVQIKINASGTSMYTINVEWASDQAFTSVLFGQFFALGGGGGNLARVFPSAGAWVRVTITAVTFVAGDTITASMVPTFIIQSPASLLNPVTIDAGTQSIAAGGSVTNGPGLIIPGPARFLIQTACTNGQVVFQELTTGGVWFTFFVINIGANGLDQSFDMLLSLNPCRYQLSNFAAGAFSFITRLGTEVFL